MSTLSTDLTGRSVVVRRAVPGHHRTEVSGVVLDAALDAHRPHITLTCTNDGYGVVLFLGEHDQISVPRAAFGPPPGSAE